MVSVSGGTSVRRRSIHQPKPASAPPIIGPTARRTGLLSGDAGEQGAERVVIGQVLDDAQQ